MDDYFPLAELQDGRRWLDDADSVRALAGLDPDRLNIAQQEREFLYSS